MWKRKRSCIPNSSFLIPNGGAPMLRIATEADVPEILSIYAPYVENTTVSFEYDVPCRKTFLDRFRTTTAQYPWLVWEEDGRILGYAYAAPAFTRAAYSWHAEPSIYLRPEARGTGIAQKLYAGLEAILKAQGYQVLYALITAENLPSLRFHEKMGYRKCMELDSCGFKFNRWVGLIWMEKRLSSVIIPNSFPTAFGSICQDVQRIRDILDSLSLS